MSSLGLCELWRLVCIVYVLLSDVKGGFASQMGDRVRSGAVSKIHVQVYGFIHNGGQINGFLDITDQEA